MSGSVEYRIEQQTESGWVWIASRIGKDSERLRSEVEDARYGIAYRSLRRHRVRRIEPDDPGYLTGPLAERKQL